MTRSLKEVRELPEFIEIQRRVEEITIELDHLLARAGELGGEGWSAGVTAANTIYFVSPSEPDIES